MAEGCSGGGGEAFSPLDTLSIGKRALPSLPRVCYSTASDQCGFKLTVALLQCLLHLCFPQARYGSPPPDDLGHHQNTDCERIVTEMTHIIQHFGPNHPGLSAPSQPGSGGARGQCEDERRQCGGRVPPLYGARGSLKVELPARWGHSHNPAIPCIHTMLDRLD